MLYLYNIYKNTHAHARTHTHTQIHKTLVSTHTCVWAVSLETEISFQFFVAAWLLYTVPFSASFGTPWFLLRWWLEEKLFFDIYSQIFCPRVHHVFFHSAVK